MKKYYLYIICGFVLLMVQNYNTQKVFAQADLFVLNEDNEFIHTPAQFQVCNGESIVFFAIGDGINAGNIRLFRNGILLVNQPTDFTDTANGVRFTLTPPNDATYTVRACTDFDDIPDSCNDLSNAISIDVADLPLVTLNELNNDNASNSFTTNDAPIVLNAGTPTANGTGVYSGTGVFVDNQSNPIRYLFVPNIVGNYSITYTFTNNNGCSASASFEVNVSEGNPSNTLTFQELQENYCVSGEVDAFRLLLNPVTNSFTFGLCQFTSVSTPQGFTRAMVYQYNEFFGFLGITEIDLNDNPVNEIITDIIITGGAGNFTLNANFNPNQLDPGTRFLFIDVFGVINRETTNSDPPNCGLPQSSINEQFLGSRFISLSPSFNPSIADLAIEPIYCPGGGDFIDLTLDFSAITPTPDPANGTFLLGRDNGSEVNFQPVNANSINVNLLPSGNYQLKYQFNGDGNYCADESPVREFRVAQLPNASFITDENTRCFGDVTSFTASVFNINNPGATAGWTWEWNFGDGTIVSAADGTPNLTHTYLNVGTYNVTLTVTNNDGCLATALQAVTISPLPQVEFTYQNQCLGTTTNFTDSTLSVAPNRITRRTWDFGDGTIIEVNTDLSNPNADDILVSHTYTNAGRYTVRLTAQTEQSCIDFLEKEVIIYPIVAQGAFPYLEDFEASEGGWFAGGRNSSWAYTIPNGTNIQTNSLSWWTSNGNNAANPLNTYSLSEESFVASPCFDIRNVEFPAVRFDYQIDTEEGADGAVLQYTTDTRENAEWKVLGERFGGEQWYNRVFISGNPGNQNFADSLKGWSGQNEQFVTARFGLDEVRQELIDSGEDYVRFRIAFGSNDINPAGVALEGFTFDNFSILSRNRIVLVEHFTNTTPNSTNPQIVTAQQEDQNINDLLNAINTQQSLVIRYEASFPVDNLEGATLANRASNSARALYYGVSEIPNTVIDGFISNSEPFSSGWGALANSRRILAEPNVTISEPILNSTDGTTLDISFDVTQIPTSADITNSLVQVCVVEKSTDPAFNLVRAFIPNTGGVRRINAADITTPLSIAVNWQATQDIDAGDFMLIVFVQDENTREVYQANFTDININLTAPGGRPSQATAGDNTSQLAFDFTIYPNPSRGDCNVWFSKIDDTVHTWILRDNLGRTVAEGQIPEATQAMKLFTHNYPSGVYTLQIDNKIKKLIIE